MALAMVVWAWVGLAPAWKVQDPAWEDPAWEDPAWEGPAWKGPDLATAWVVDLATVWEALDMVVGEWVGQGMMDTAWALDLVGNGMLENAALQRRSGEA